MNRRAFVNYLAAAAAGIAGIMLIDESLIRKVWYRLEGILKPSVELPPDAERGEAIVPADGQAVSVEKALNSRCTSDYDGVQKKFHWGLFDPAKKLSNEQVVKVTNHARIPRFSKGKVQIRTEGSTLSFVIDDRASGREKDWMMMESGMQQQAVCVVCAALGIGCVFRSQGKDGTSGSGGEWENIRIRLDPMKTSYGGSYWSDEVPGDSRPWLKGNLPDPVRDGGKSLTEALAEVKTEHAGGRKASDGDLGQILWAARGRTPHYYKSTPWGLTIPTWGGEQNISGVHVVSGGNILTYVNWDRGRPTHSLEKVKHLDDRQYKDIVRLAGGMERFLVLSKNEEFARALWEIGFQVLNALVQAHSLGASYKAVLLNDEGRLLFKEAGIEGAQALVGV